MYFGFYTCIIELILVLRNVYLYIGAHPCISDLILVLQSIYMYCGTYTCTKVPVGTTHIHYTEVPVGTTHIHYAEVPVSTTGLIFILQNLYLYYRYGSTRRYYRDITCTKVPVGTREQIQRYP